MTGQQIVEAQDYARATVQRILRNKSEDEVDDVLQSAALNAVKFQGQFEGRSKFNSYFTRIAINQALMLLRSRGKELEFKDVDARYDDLLLYEPASPQPTPERRTFLAEVRATILRVIGQMPRMQRRGALEYINGDVANTSTKKARRHKAVEKLRLALQARGLHD